MESIDRLSSEVEIVALRARTGEVDTERSWRLAQRLIDAATELEHDHPQDARWLRSAGMTLARLAGRTAKAARPPGRVRYTSVERTPARTTSMGGIGA